MCFRVTATTPACCRCCLRSARMEIRPGQALSFKSHRKLGDVGCFESPYFFVAQFEVNSRDCVSQMLLFGHATNRRSHRLLLQQPCQTDLRHGNMAFSGNGFHAITDWLIGSPSLEAE